MSEIPHNITAAQRHHIKKFLNTLKSVKGRHTELVSVYIPAGFDINKVITQLTDEAGTATNIKSNSTRKNVIGSLEKMIITLKQIQQTPPNGLALFSANVSENEGKLDFQCYWIEPPIPLSMRLYRCDKEFVFEPLEDMVETKEVYGLVTMDRREGTLGFLRGKSIVVIDHHESNVPGKTRAGGQSSQRFERLREGAATEFFKKIAESMKKNFLPLVAQHQLKGIIIGGPGPTKYDFAERGYITQEVTDNIISIQDISNTDEVGLYDLVEKAQDVLANEDVVAEKKIIGEFLAMLATEQPKTTYGYAQTKEALEMGAVEKLLVSEELDDKQLEVLEELAVQFNSEVHICSTETREGVQLRDLGKVAGILRYPLH